MPKIEWDLDCADRNRKAVTHAEGRAISGISILGVRQVPEIERDLDRADRNVKAVAHAEGRPVLGISILGAHEVPKIEQNNANTGLVTKWHDMADAARRMRAWKREACNVGVLNAIRRDRNRAALQERQRQHNVADRALRHAADRAAVKAGSGRRLAESVHAIAQQNDASKQAAARQRKISKLASMWDGVVDDVKSAGLAKLKGIVCSIADQTAHALGESLVSITNPNARNWHHSVQLIGERQRSEWNDAGVHHVDADSMRHNLQRYVDQMPTALRALGGKAEDKAATARLLGAAVQHAVRSQVSMRTVDVWDEQRFHAVKIPMRIVGAAKGHKTIEAIADTGAGLELAPEDRLSVEILKDTLQPGRARLMHSASANRLAGWLAGWLAGNRLFIQKQRRGY